MMSTNPSQWTTRPDTDLAEPISVVLSDPRRHHVVAALAARPGRSSTFDDLTVAVTAFERTGLDGDPGDSSSQVAVTLHHCHLPKLVQAGVVEPGYDEGEVELTERGIECAAALDLDRFDR
jgi:hypothetical protein